MTTAQWLTTATIGLLLLLSAFFSGSETALTAASRARVHKLATEGNRRATLVEKLLLDPERLIGAILLGNNLVNILASALATKLFLDLVGESGVVYATIVMTLLVLIFAEVLPKTYAITNPDRTALSVGPAIRLIVSLFSPVVGAVRAIVRVTFKLVGIDISKEQRVLSPTDEIRGAIDLHASEGGIIKEHRDMLGSILDLDDVTVEDIMIHRNAMVTIDANDRPADILSKVCRSPYTRMPVYEGDAENIIGVLHAKDVLRGLHAPGATSQTINIRDLMVEPWFVPETTSLREQLDAFLERRGHFAVVVDEYGAIMGLVTLEDILEEIVGEITDEHDFQVEGVKPERDGSYLIDGGVSIRDLNRRFDWRLSDDDATTIAGLVIHYSETIPILGQKFRFHGFEFEVLGRKRNQITQVRARKI